MKNKYELLSSINDKDTKMVIAKIFDLYDKAKEEYKFTCTQFLSPNMVSLIVDNIYNDIEVKIYGGYNNAERVAIGFCPKSYDIYINNDIFNIDILKVTYNNKFSDELKHSDYLGSIMGLSIKRELIGDILIEDNQAYIFVQNSISDYIIDNLKKIRRTNVNIDKVSNNIEIQAKKLEEQKTTVTSLRIDVLIAKIFNISRNEVNELFLSGKVFLNWVSLFDNSKIIKNDDIITVRGYGRVKYIESVGTNKKGKIAFTFLRY